MSNNTSKQQPLLKPYYNFRVKGLYVYYDGKTVLREYPDKYALLRKRKRRLTIKTDKDGNKYVTTKDGGDIRVDLMVATCYCHREPGHNYVIHIDKNKANCHRFNLKWVTAEEYRNHYKDELTYTDANTGKVWVWAVDDVYVTEKGEVRIDGVDQTVNNLVSDSDLGCCRCVMPYVSKNYRSKSYHVEELVAEVFCTKLSDVADQDILHVDYNFLNNEASNLKWVEKTDPEYIKYEEQRKKDWSAINLQHSTMP